MPHGARLQAALPPQDSSKLQCCCFKEVCLLLGRAGGSGESQRTPAEIPYSWGRLAFSTRQEPLPCSNIPSLPLGEPADEISIAVTPAKPSTRAWEGGRAAPWGAKRGCTFPKAPPGVARGCLRAGGMGDALGDAQESFRSQQRPSSLPRVTLGSFQCSSALAMGSPQPIFTALNTLWCCRNKFHLKGQNIPPKHLCWGVPGGSGGAHRVLLADPTPEIPP